MLAAILGGCWIFVKSSGGSQCPDDESKIIEKQGSEEGSKGGDAVLNLRTMSANRTFLRVISNHRREVIRLWVS